MLKLDKISNTLTLCSDERQNTSNHVRRGNCWNNFTAKESCWGARDRTLMQIWKFIVSEAVKHQMRFRLPLPCFARLSSLERRGGGCCVLAPGKQQPLKADTPSPLTGAPYSTLLSLLSDCWAYFEVWVENSVPALFLACLTTPSYTTPTRMWQQIRLSLSLVWCSNLREGGGTTKLKASQP